ncbi:hypothetical protein [Nocardiopsis sp. FR26]|uniref:hypothetical protein n=1 Tax=Nocardiopsis sp. FR26 TaxID=2605987 RepID=UPI0013592AF5|nr:hypothetical protein [Nocardiopsis sp. FR26]
MGLFGPSREELQQQAHFRHIQVDAAQAQRERQVRITRADVEEVKSICLTALEAADVGYGYRKTDQEITEAKLTRGGLIIRGVIHATDTSLWSPKSYRCFGDAQKAMRAELQKLGYLVAEDFGQDGLIVTGWDPLTYEGTQLSPERIDERIAELQQIRAEVEAFQDQTEAQGA